MKTRGRTLNFVAKIYDPVLYLATLGSEPHYRRLIADIAQVKSDEQILDVGCGTGTQAVEIAKRLKPPGHVYGIDAASKMIGVAKKKEKKFPGLVTFQAALAESLPFPDETFDCVVNTFFIHHLPLDLKRIALREMLRVLKREGKLITVDVDKPYNLFGKIIATLSLIEITIIDNFRIGLYALLEKAGFSDITFEKRIFGFISFLTAKKK